MAKDQEFIENAMARLGISEVEAQEMLDSDKQIDRGAKLFSLNAEGEKASKDARKTGTKKHTVYNFATRERKPNETKEGIIAALFKYLNEESSFLAENVTVANPERQIAFSIGETKFELTLVQKRPPKNKK